MKPLISIALLLSMTATANAGIFKCTEGDQVSYQSTPCTAENEDSGKGVDQKAGKQANQMLVSETILIKGSRVETLSEQCESSCSTTAMTCRSKLIHGNYNSDGGLEVCVTLKASCESSCNKHDNADALERQYLKLKKAYENKLKRMKSEKKTEARNQQLAIKTAAAKESAKKRCVLRETAKIEKTYSPIDQLDASQRRRYKSALETVEKNC